MSDRSLLLWSSGALTHQGNVRRTNEDAYLELPELGLWTVADGMGGHQAGDLASQMIVDTLSEVQEPSNLDTFIDDVTQNILFVNQRLREIAQKKFAHDIIGCTVVSMLVYGSQCAFLWAGDSRVYRRRNNTLQQLTLDHNMLQDFLDKGMALKEALQYPECQILTRAVGADDQLEIAVWVDELLDGDRYLLCSDGLYKELSDHEINTILANENSDSTSLAQQFMDQSLAKTGRDNITVVVVGIHDAFA